jgi:DNA-binding winged helix-turn-helix (wHTH) protein/TolB-like protein/Flp pilus assembly protein TadD
LYSFGPFSLDAKECLLLREGKPIPLKPKVFDLLLTLVANVGHVLSKDELMNRIWGDSVVEEHNLTVSISLLRVALGDNHRQPRYIETVAKRGYRFVAPVELLPHEAAVVHNLAVDLSGEGLGERLPEISSLAVLPFKNMTTQARNQYLGLGLADALITRLSKLTHVTVRPTSAVLKLGGRPPVSVGRQLRVETILDGSIQKWSKQIRVTAQHVRVCDGVILWAAKFDEQFTNLFAVEDSISEQVANAFSAGLTETQRGQLRKRHTDQADAYHAYLKGRYFLNKRSADGFAKCLKYFNLAIQMDPNYALAYAGLATCYNLLGGYILAPPREAVRKAKAAALQSLKLDYELAEAHTVLGHIKMRCDWDWSGAEEALKLAIKLNPSSAHAHQIYSVYLRTTGRLQEAMFQIRRARELDPISLAVNASLGGLLYLARRYDEAVEQLKNTIEMDCNFSIAHFFLGFTYAHQSRIDLAIIEYQKVVELMGENTESTAFMGHAFARLGRIAEAQKLLRKLEDDARVKHVSPYLIAIIHTALGNFDDAFGCLERAFEEQDEELALIKMDPMLDPLRGDPRFEILLKGIGLAP